VKINLVTFVYDELELAVHLCLPVEYVGLHGCTTLPRTVSFYFALFYLFTYFVVLTINPKASGWVSLCCLSFSSFLLGSFNFFYFIERAFLQLH
jgi:hypothetical protein